MALDEPRQTDKTEDAEGIPFVMEPRVERLVGEYRDVRVDNFPDSGFYAATTLSAACCC